MSREPHVLVIAGSDSSGGAGIARDVETIGALGLRSCLAVTAVTVQTHMSADRIETMPPDLVVAQMRAALGANRVRAIKIGMLGTSQAIAAVATILGDYADIPAILDPLLASSSGRALLAEDAVAALRRDLIPLCSLVTPNLAELAALAESAFALNEASACRQGNELLAAAGTAVLVKGGHAQGAQATDILLRAGHPAIRFDARRLPGQMRGTGCMLSSAIAACLALGESLEASVRKAKQYVFDRFGRAA